MGFLYLQQVGATLRGGFSCCRFQKLATEQHLAVLAASHRLWALKFHLWHVGSEIVACRLQSVDSVAVARGRRCSAHVESSQTRDPPTSPALPDRFLSNTPPGKSKTTVSITIMEVWMNQTMNSGSSPKIGIMDYFNEEQNQQIRGSSLLLKAIAEKTSIHIGSLSTFFGYLSYLTV